MLDHGKHAWFVKSIFPIIILIKSKFDQLQFNNFFKSYWCNTDVCIFFFSTDYGRVHSTQPGGIIEIDFIT